MTRKPPGAKVVRVEPDQINCSQLIDCAVKAPEWHSPVLSLKILICQTLGF